MRTLVATVGLVVLLGAAGPAHASFPGRNGGIAFAEFSASGDFDAQSFESSGIGFAPQPIGTETHPRDLVRCERTDGVVSGGNCTTTSYRSPSYSPNGKRIVFDAGEQLGAIGAGGAGLYLLAPVTADDGEPCFSPDGKSIAFTGANDHGGTDLYTRRVAGGEARLIVHDADQPAWSSRNRIAYVRSGDVYTSNPNGGKRRHVGAGVSPDWSPNGRRLVLIRPSGTGTSDGILGRIYIVDADGDNLRPLGRRRDASRPVWSPDGRWLAFDKFDSGVFARRLGSRKPALIVAESQFSGENGSNSYFEPTWRPLLLDH